jgi:hypothetical protein
MNFLVKRGRGGRRGRQRRRTQGEPFASWGPVGCWYGSFAGGDPRRFNPDPECSDDAETLRWAAACQSGQEQPSAGRVGTLGFEEHFMFGLGVNHADPCTCGGLKGGRR